MVRHVIQLAIALALAKSARILLKEKQAELDSVSDETHQVRAANHLQSAPSLLSTVFNVMKMYQEHLGNTEVVVVQLDAATFPPAQHAALIVRNSSTWPETVVEVFIQPAGRAIALSNANLFEGFNRWDLLAYGAATKINSKDAAHLSVVSHWEQFAGNGLPDNSSVLGLSFLTNATSYIPKMICKDSGTLAGGRVYVYTGGCGPEAFKDILGFGDWRVDSSTSYEFFSSVFCGKLGEDKRSTCLQYLACAMDELYWSPGTIRFQGGTVHVAGSARCSEAGAKRRAGFFHEHQTCNCDLGECDFCGTEGLCCQLPLHPFDNEKEAHGCGWRGCIMRKCCVPRLNDTNTEIPEPQLHLNGTSVES